jgi:outer membrane protein assembly factor BamE (lipoprotein component of BamABCDE complex)
MTVERYWKAWFIVLAALIVLRISVIPSSPSKPSNPQVVPQSTSADSIASKSIKSIGASSKTTNKKRASGPTIGRPKQPSSDPRGSLPNPIPPGAVSPNMEQATAAQPASRGDSEPVADAKLKDSVGNHELHRDFFTVGSSKDEVLTVQGSPASFNDSTWSYGYSRVYFRNDHVSTWSNSTVNPLRAKLLPTGPVTTSRGYFTVGSTKDEVLTVQGTPSSFNDSTWSYGYSRVYFRDDHVSTWSDSTVNPLRAKLLPTGPVTTSRGYFTVGSTKDEVLTVQGTPSSFNDSTWSYGYSNVYFRDDRVSTWSDSTVNPLRARMLPTGPVTISRGYFTVGSTKDEVLTVQGTPSSFNDSTWSYGYSNVYFRDGRVFSWSNSTINPLKVKK